MFPLVLASQWGNKKILLIRRARSLLLVSARNHDCSGGPLLGSTHGLLIRISLLLTCIYPSTFAFMPGIGSSGYIGPTNIQFSRYMIHDGVAGLPLPIIGIIIIDPLSLWLQLIVSLSYTTQNYGLGNADIHFFLVKVQRKGPHNFLYQDCSKWSLTCQSQLHI